MKKALNILLCFVVLFFVGKRVYQSPEKQAIKRINQLYYAGNFEKAKKELEAHLKKYPGSSQSWSYLGLVKLELDDTIGAEAAYKKGLDLDSNNDKAIVGLGIVLRLKGNYNAARQYYQRAMKINPGNPDIYASLMVLELKNKDYAKAVELGEKAKAMDMIKSKPGILANLVIAYHLANKVKERDATLAELKRTNYPNVKYVEMIIKGEVNAEGLF